MNFNIHNLSTAQAHFLDECLANGLELAITQEGVRIEGFYKSGSVTLSMPYGSDEGDVIFKCIARYGEETNLYSFDNLVELNFNWWVRSADRLSDWRQPDPKWRRALVEHGYAKEETIVAAVKK